MSSDYDGVYRPGPGPPLRHCSRPGCTKLANGLCHNCSSAARQRTSDGVRVSNKLTDEQVAEARRMYAAFRTKRDIARHFGVRVSTLNRYFARPRT